MPLKLVSEKSSNPEKLLLPLAVDIPRWQKELFCCNEDIAADILEAYGFGHDTTEDEAISFIESLSVETVEIKISPYGCFFVLLVADDIWVNKFTYPLILTDAEFAFLQAYIASFTAEQLGVSPACYNSTMDFFK